MVVVPLLFSRKRAASASSGMGMTKCTIQIPLGNSNNGNRPNQNKQSEHLHKTLRCGAFSLETASSGNAGLSYYTRHLSEAQQENTPARSSGVSDKIRYLLPLLPVKNAVSRIFPTISISAAPRQSYCRFAENKNPANLRWWGFWHAVRDSNS